MLEPTLKKNDSLAKKVIYLSSAIVFAAILVLSRYKLEVDLGFDPHVFALINAILNTGVAMSLLFGLWCVRLKKYDKHKTIMQMAIVLSIFFLLAYICHHLFTNDTKFGDVNGDNAISAEEKEAVGGIRYLYYTLLLTHIPLAGLILPVILFTAYRALIGEYENHKKLARITWPIWFYVAVSGVVIYLMIEPYYQ
jgi:putative membrane protein